MQDPLDPLRQRWADHAWGAVDEMVVYAALLRVRRLVQLEVEKSLRRAGLTTARHTLLLILDYAPGQSLTIGQLSRWTMAHPTSVTRLVDHLSASGLVRRTVPSHDKRSVVVTLTDAGATLLEKAGPALGATRFGLGALDDVELAALGQALQRVREDAGDITRWRTPSTDTKDQRALQLGP